jgi:hypothetical protein
MKLLKPLISILALFISGSIVAQSVEIVSPDEGDSVNMDGFMIHATIEGLQELINEEHEDAFIQLGLMQDEFWEGAYVGAFCQPGASYNFHFWGRCLKFVHPDMYLNSFCDIEGDRLRIVYRAENFAEEMYLQPGDSIDLRLRAWGHNPPKYFEDIVSITVE